MTARTFANSLPCAECDYDLHATAPIDRDEVFHCSECGHEWTGRSLRRELRRTYYDTGWNWTAFALGSPIFIGLLWTESSSGYEDIGRLLAFFLLVLCSTCLGWWATRKHRKLGFRVRLIAVFMFWHILFGSVIASVVGAFASGYLM